MQVVELAVANNGTINVNQGRADFKGTITGDGDISLFGNVAFEAEVAATQTVTFTGHFGSMTLGDPSAFKAAVAGLREGGNIELTGFAPSAATFTYSPDQDNAGGVLDIISGSRSAAINLDGSFLASGFHLAPDYTGTDTVVSYVPPAV